MKMKDLAEIIGVSPGTISNALNNRKGVSEEQRKRILALAKEHGYVKRESKKSEKKENRKSEKKGIIRFIVFKNSGIVFGDTPFFSALIEGIERKTFDEGYELAISHITENECTRVKELTASEEVVGVILLATEMLPENLHIIEKIKRPTVVVDSYFKSKNYDFVLIDNSGGVKKAMDHLIENGHKEIGFLQSSIYINNFYYRYKEYKDSMYDNKFKVNSDFTYKLTPTLEGAYKDMLEYLKTNKNNLPTAFMADNDIIAIGAMRALSEFGIKMPEDISIVGFDDMPFSEVSNPRLTTIRVFKEYFGEMAVKRLIGKINNNDKMTLKIEVETELIERDSVKNLK